MPPRPGLCHALPPSGARPTTADPRSRPMVPPSTEPPSRSRSEGLIEIILPDGVSLRVDAQVNVKALRRVLDALRGQ